MCSDSDAVDTSVLWKAVSQLEDALRFEESSLSLMVDVVDLHAVSTSFRDRIADQLTPFAYRENGTPVR